MKLHLTLPGDGPLFTGYGPGYVDIGGERHHGNTAMAGGRLIVGWTPRRFETLTEDDMAFIAEAGVEIALLGTGDRLRFPPQALMRPLAGKRVGLDVMDTQAACRTYNILVAEGRKVGAFLLLAEQAD
jgi:uncharacterized protein